MVKIKKGKYKTLDEEKYYETTIGKGVVSISEDVDTGNKTISFSKQVRTKENNWVVRKGRGKFFVVPFRFIGKITDILIKFARKFGWRVEEIERPEEEIKRLKKQLDDAIRQKTDLEEALKNSEIQIKYYKDGLKKYRKQIIKNNIEVFKRDLEEFKDLLNKSESQKINEEEIQRFLAEKKWIFGPEYHNAQPKKPVGSKSKLDFYLEDYKGRGTIVELELPSDSIFSKNEEYGLSSKCAESLGQLIRYIETTIAISHGSETSRIEGISEMKPLGFLIIGRTKTEEEIRRLETVNFYFHKSIEILSYDMLLNKAKALLSPFIGDEK